MKLDGIWQDQPIKSPSAWLDPRNLGENAMLTMLAVECNPWLIHVNPVAIPWTYSLAFKVEVADYSSCRVREGPRKKASKKPSLDHNECRISRGLIRNAEGRTDLQFC